MLQHIENSSHRLDQLHLFAKRLIDGENGKLLIEEFRNYIDTVNATEAMQVLDALLVDGYSLEKVKEYTGKLINVFFKSLDSIKWNKPAEGHFLYYLMLENREVEKRMNAIRPVIKKLFNEEGYDDKLLFAELQQLIDALKEYELHYIKKENILFSYIERVFPQYRCIKIMWSFDDDFRRSLKTIEGILRMDTPDKGSLNKELGKLFFIVFPLIFREEQIVFPVALRAVPENAWFEMMEQSFETGWCYGIQPVQKETHDSLFSNETGLVNLDTGLLNAEQLILLFNHLPVDITYVDQNDEVRYFSGAKHRIFPRSKAIIGRKVQNCHPPESVHIVNEIIDAFRSGRKSVADFRINMKGRFISIRYFALRNEKNEYCGTLEVSEDVTEIRAAQGEQRLLDWK